MPTSFSSISTSSWALSVLNHRMVTGLLSPTDRSRAVPDVACLRARLHLCGRSITRGGRSQLAFQPGWLRVRTRAPYPVRASEPTNNETTAVPFGHSPVTHSTRVSPAATKTENLSSKLRPRPDDRRRHTPLFTLLLRGDAERKSAASETTPPVGFADRYPMNHPSTDPGPALRSRPDHSTYDAVSRLETSTITGIRFNRRRSALRGRDGGIYSRSGRLKVGPAAYQRFLLASTVRPDETVDGVRRLKMLRRKRRTFGHRCRVRHELPQTSRLTSPEARPATSAIVLRGRRPFSDRWPAVLARFESSSRRCHWLPSGRRPNVLCRASLLHFADVIDCNVTRRQASTVSAASILAYRQLSTLCCVREAASLRQRLSELALQIAAER